MIVNKLFLTLILQVLIMYVPLISMDIHSQFYILYICFGINKYGTDVIRIQIPDPCFSLKIQIRPLNSNTRRKKLYSL